MLCGKQNAQSSVRGGRPQAGGVDQVAVNSMGENHVWEGELRQIGSSRGHAPPIQRGMRKGLQCLWPNELLDGV